MSNSQENNMKKEFDEIVRLCEEAIPEYGERASYFMEPATEEEILEWEKTTNIRIPESYKSWLRLTKCCQMQETVGEFYFPDIHQPEYVPEGYVMIGNIIGDGEIVCFSKDDGKFITYFEGKINEEFDDFQAILLSIKDLLKDEIPELNLTEEKIQAMMAELEEIRKKKKENK